MNAFDINYKIDVLKALKEDGYSLFRLKNEGLLSAVSISNLRNKKYVSFSTLGTLCNLLKCQPGDLIQYGPGDGMELICLPVTNATYNRLASCAFVLELSVQELIFTSIRDYCSYIFGFNPVYGNVDALESDLFSGKVRKLTVRGQFERQRAELLDCLRFTNDEGVVSDE